MTQDEFRELDAKLLCAYFNWRWMRTVSRNLCSLVPPEPWTEGRWRPVSIPANPSTYFALVEGVPPIEKRFQDWWTCADLNLFGRGYRRGIPSPSTNPADCAELRAELAKNHRIRIEYSLHCEPFDGNGIMVFVDGLGSFEPYSLHSSPIAAECMAVARAAEKLIEAN